MQGIGTVGTIFGVGVTGLGLMTSPEVAVVAAGGAAITAAGVVTLEKGGQITSTSAGNYGNDFNSVFQYAHMGEGKAVNNMSEFFKTKFGSEVKNNLSKTKIQYDGQSVYEVTGKVKNEYLKKGDKIYLDNLHKDHLEVFDKRGRAKAVINLDGTLNVSKTEISIKEGRTIGK